MISIFHRRFFDSSFVSFTLLNFMQFWSWFPVLSLIVSQMCISPNQEEWSSFLNPTWTLPGNSLELPISIRKSFIDPRSKWNSGLKKIYINCLKPILLFSWLTSWGNSGKQRWKSWSSSHSSRLASLLVPFWVPRQVIRVRRHRRILSIVQCVYALRTSPDALMNSWFAFQSFRSWYDKEKESVWNGKEWFLKPEIIMLSWIRLSIWEVISVLSICLSIYSISIRSDRGWQESVWSSKAPQGAFRQATCAAGLRPFASLGW